MVASSVLTRLRRDPTPATEVVSRVVVATTDRKDRPTVAVVPVVRSPCFPHVALFLTL
jgi:hypothetical protein